MTRRIFQALPRQTDTTVTLIYKILYMKHDNINMYDVFMWKWSFFALCDDVLFIAPCINHALSDEI
jgi:hypothetical protein